MDLWATTKGGRIATTVSGDGSSPTVLVAGWGATRRFWRPQVQALAPVARVVTYDRRGYGDSEPTLPGHDLAAEVADLAAVVDQVAGPGRLRLVAHSFGGGVAMAYAAAYPERVDRMVLISASPCLRQDSSFPIGIYTAEGAAAVLDNMDGTGLAPFVNSLVPEPGLDNLRAALMQGIPAAASYAHMRDDFRLSLAADLRAALPVLTMPLLVVHGTADQVIPFTHGVYLYGRLPNPRFLPLPERGHLPTFTAREQVNAALLGFLLEPLAAAV